MGWDRKFDGGRGSRPRCALLTNGGRDGHRVAPHPVVGPPGVVISPGNRWQPRGRLIGVYDRSWDLLPSHHVDLTRPNGPVAPSVWTRFRYRRLTVQGGRSRRALWTWLRAVGKGQLRTSAHGGEGPSEELDSTEEQAPLTSLPATSKTASERIAELPTGFLRQ